jgi:hypothetical protein
LRQQQACRLKLNQARIGDTTIRACGKAAARERIVGETPVEGGDFPEGSRLTSLGSGNNMGCCFCSAAPAFECRPLLGFDGRRRGADVGIVVF